MSYEFYKTVHYLGLSMVILSVGGMLVHAINGGTKQSNSFRKGAIITHGVGLLLLLVAGFGMMAKLGIHGMPAWVGGKLVIWLVFGAMAALAYKQQLACKLWFAVPVLVVIASVLVRMK